MNAGDYTQLGLRNFPRRVAREIKKAAAQRGVTLTEFMVSAATCALRNPHEHPSVSADLERDVAWFERNRLRLASRYRSGTSLAVVGEEIVDHDDDAAQLLQRMRARYGRRPIFMPRIGEEPTPVRRIRSPRRVR